MPAIPSVLTAPVNPGNTTTTPNPTPIGNGGVPGFPNGGSPSDMLKWLSGYSLNKSQQVDPNLNATLQGFYQRSNEGLSPEAMTAMMRESTSGLQDRYNTAASALRTSLLQRGVYGGQLPANSGQMFAAFGPLQEGLLQAQSKAGTDAILANNQALLANRQLGLQAVGAGLNLQQLQQQGVSQAIQAAYARGEIEPTTMKNIVLASLLGAGTKALTDPKILKSIGGMLGIGGPSPLSAAETSFLGGGADTSDLSSAISAMGGAGSAAGGALAAGAAGAIPAGAIPGTLDAGALASLFGTTGTEVAAPGAFAGSSGAAAASATTGSTGLGASLGAFFSNPITIGVGAALAGALIWKHTQVHPTADKFVQTYQNPFGSHLGSVVNEFDKAYATGHMTADQAQLARNQTADLIAGFDKQIDDWIAAGGKERIVAKQARRTMTEDFGPNWSLVLGKMDAEISALKQAQGVGTA